MKTLKLALMGFGNVGQAFGKMLLEKQEEIIEKYDTEVKITAVATATKGNLYNPEGIDIAKAIDGALKGKFQGPDVTESEGMELLENGVYDCLVELSPLDIFTGQPATDHIKMAIGRRKHAITANKGPVAWFFRELRDMADYMGVGFFYETVVMDGTPVFNLVEHTLKMAKVTEVRGILNSTTNFILEELEKGCDMDDIMARGRQMGFIEADPAMDIEGYDAAGKVTALLNVLMDAGITPDQVKRKGIEDVTVDDIRAAAGRGNVIKLLCRGTLDEDGRVIAEVAPQEIPRTDMLASVNSTTSIVSITTDLMKTVSIVEHEPEIEQTAYGVFGDMLRVLEML